jgi:hypothetical protein
MENLPGAGYSVVKFGIPRASQELGTATAVCNYAEKLRAKIVVYL